jgi:hypothetical protein
METLCYSRYYRKRLNGHTNGAKIENSKEGGKEKNTTVVIVAANEASQ